MNFLKKIDKKSFKYSKIRNFYIISMLLALCFRTIGIYSFVPVSIDSAFFSLVGAFGAVVLFIGTAQKKIFISKENFWVLSSFLAVLLISSVLNIKYGFFGNLKHFIWTSISFFVLFAGDKDSNKSTQEKLFYRIQNILVILWLIFSSLSLMTFIFQINYLAPIDDKRLFFFGYVENRLYGVYLNTNYSSMIALLTVIFSANGIFSNSKYKLKNWINILNIIIQFFYLVLAYSRGTTVAMISLTFICTFIFFFKSGFFEKHKILKMIFCILISVAACLALHFGVKVVRVTISYLPGLIHGSIERVSISRHDVVNNTDISNMRYSIWLSGLEIFKRNWLFGVSPGNILTYAKNVIPWTFIAVKNYTRIHNAYIGIAIYTGILGFCIMVWFWIKNFFSVIPFKNIKEFLKNPNSPVISINSVTAVLSVVCVAIYGLTESEILFVNSICSLVFWVSFGMISTPKISEKH